MGGVVTVAATNVVKANGAAIPTISSRTDHDDDWCDTEGGNIRENDGWGGWMDGWMGSIYI